MSASCLLRPSHCFHHLQKPLETQSGAHSSSTVPQNGENSLCHHVCLWLTISSKADKLRTQQQLEALQNKYIGTGHADTTKHEWTSNIMRDSYASFQGHPSTLLYMSVGMGTNVEAVRRHCMERMVLPVGPPPATEDE